MNPEIREMLLGHMIGLAFAYYKPTQEDMLNEYLKAVNLLTINEENRLKQKVEILEIEKSQLATLKEDFEKKEDPEIQVEIDSGATVKILNDSSI